MAQYIIIYGPGFGSVEAWSVPNEKKNDNEVSMARNIVNIIMYSRCGGALLVLIRLLVVRQHVYMRAEFAMMIKLPSMNWRTPLDGYGRAREDDPAHNYIWSIHGWTNQGRGPTLHGVRAYSPRLFFWCK